MLDFLDKHFKGDRVIWSVVLILSVLSLLAVYSSVVTLAYKSDRGALPFLFKHGFFLAVGIGIIYLTHRLKFKYYSRISQVSIIIVIPLLLLTLIVGANINDASRWLTIPIINQTFQTSDFAKLALIMYLARLLSKNQENIKDFKTAFVPVMIPIIIICGLILPANFSTAAMLFATSLVVMFIGRINIKYIAGLVGIGITSLVFLLSLTFAFPDLLPRANTWKKRIENFSSGESSSNYQAEQAKIAIATGGIIGKGPGKSTQRNFLPHPYSDFIYAMILEEYGLVGGATVLFLYLVILFRGIRISAKCENPFGSLLAIGLSFALVFQGMINMAVAVNLFPVTGQPLPMVSMGGSSVWFTCIAIGIILSVSRADENEEVVMEKSGNSYAVA